ncbi:uncharacterized protein LOC106179965 [Lingula anatina]|uniref:Uncharacterized protein LOC106179965 n=1 Tax=Lingula anatina TaxID=7574 RepID=A0A1S3KAJ7_LINAN|nr:uncharacterized protein LOC106179965 [Lingula anatina]|eukprot:XP_013419286.1 uncharacterized protein LOC106179965 [Lingula anatina]
MAAKDPCDPNPCPETAPGHPIPCKSINGSTNFECVRPNGYCLYSNALHRQGEVWDIGCKQTCRCIKSSANFVYCQPKCQDWDGMPIPAGCILDPPKLGECCQNLNCDSLTPPP